MSERQESCPHCGASMQGTEIPEQQREMNGGKTHWRREIGVEVMGDYDGVLYWECPDCGGTWHRWPEGSSLRERAEKFMLGRQP